jgi:hypothetical protein
MNFQDQDTQQQGKNPFNANILKGGQVDPRSKLYQRSIAGREKLDEMLQRLWDQGADEADVFMAGVRALTSRDKGYVGAYLDSKNPGRRYQDNEAKAITDQVMSDLGIGEHPGARLTRPKDGEGKEERKTSNQMRGAFGPGRPEGEAPRKAMPVGQQRKQGKRSSTGQALEDSRRPSQEEERQKRAEGKQDYYYTGTNVQREFMDIMKDGTRKIQERVDSGQITAEQAVKEMSKLKDQALTQAGKESNEVRRSRGDLTPKEQEQADKKKQRQDDMRQRIAEQKGLRDREAAAGPEPEEEFKPTIDGVGIREAFGAFYNKALQRTGLDLKSHVKRLARSREGFSTDLGDIINEIEEKGFKVDPDEFKKAVERSFGINVDNYPGWDSEIKSGAAQEPAAAPEPKAAAAPEPSAAGTKEPAAAPEPERQNSKPGQFKGKVAEDIGPEDIGPDEESLLRKYKRAMEEYRLGRGLTGRMEDSYRSGLEWAASRGLPTGAEAEKEILESRKQQPTAAGTKEPPAAPKPEAPATAPTEGAAAPEPAAAPKPEAPTPAPTEGAAAPEPAAPAASPSEEEAPEPAQRKRTKAETQEIQRRGSEELAKTQETNRKLEAMTKRMANSPLVKDEKMRNWINNDLDRLLKSFTPAEKTEDPWEQEGPEARGIPEPAAQAPASQKALAGQPGPKGLLSPGKEPPVSKKKRTRAETQEIEKRGSEELAKTQETNRKLEAMTQRMANSPAVKSEEMRNWINNDLDRLLKSFTPAEKTEDPWEQDGPEATGIPEPAAQAPASQKALAGQPGPRGLLSPGKEPQAPPPASGRRTKAQGDEIRRRGQETLEQLQRGAATGRRMANSPVAEREDEINRRGEEVLREIQNSPTPRKGRRTKAEGDEIRRRGQEALEQIQGEARRGREVQSRMANSPAATGEAPRTGREADITRRGEEELKSEVYGNIKNRPGMTNREANRILREGGYTQPKPGLDAAARVVTDGLDRHDAAVKRIRGKRGKISNNAEYQEFAQSIRSIMR